MVQLAGGGSYTDLQSTSAGLLSPLDHYWSLAIEEQFYWLWPLCFWGLARFARRRGWSLTRILLVLTVAFGVASPVIAVVLPAAGGPAYHGALPLLAVASAGPLLGVQRPGVATTALSSRPLVALGAISYGVYLFRFPVFVFMSPARVGQDGAVLLLMRLAVTLVVALASYWLVVRPIRHAT